MAGEGSVGWVGGESRADTGEDALASGGLVHVIRSMSASLDPRWPVWRTVAEAAPRATRADVAGLFAAVGPDDTHLDVRPQQLSGGQAEHHPSRDHLSHHRRR